MTTPPKPRLMAVAGVMAVSSLLVAGCQATPVQPRTSVSCTPGHIAIEVTNVSSAAARYTVTVEITRAGDTETEQYSSNRIEAGKSATITDVRPPEQAKRRVSSAEAFTA